MSWVAICVGITQDDEKRSADGDCDRRYSEQEGGFIRGRATEVRGFARGGPYRDVAGTALGFELAGRVRTHADR